MGTDWQGVVIAAAWSPERLIEVSAYTLIFVGAILVLALVVSWVDRWRKRKVEPGTSAGDQLSHFRQLYERGALSPEEFARIRGLLGERLRQELQVPTPPSPEIQLDEPPAPAPPTPPVHDGPQS